MNLGGLLIEQFHDFIVFGTQLAIVGRITVPQDVMRHPLGDAGRLGQRQDGCSEIPDVRGESAAALACIGSRVPAGEEPAGVRVLVFQGQ